MNKLKLKIIEANPEKDWKFKIIKDEEIAINYNEPIRLADVLLAMRDKFINRISKEFKDNVIKLLMKWNFREDLDHQSKETIKFLEDLLNQ